MWPLLQLNLFGVCMARVSSGIARFQARRLFVSEFDIESCSRSSSYKLPPRAADALDIIPESIHQVFVFVMDVLLFLLDLRLNVYKRLYFFVSTLQLVVFLFWG